MIETDGGSELRKSVRAARHNEDNDDDDIYIYIYMCVCVCVYVNIGYVV